MRIHGGHRLLVAALLLVLSIGSAPAATMQIVNGDADGEGLNDRTSVAPLGGNDGGTRGAQRRIALQYAADILGSRLDSAVPIRIAVRFETLGCSATRASLGQTAPAQFATGFADAARADTLYPAALANALAGRRVAAGTSDIAATFNAALDGEDGCLGGRRWYYGLDRAPGAGEIDFIGTVLHELIHGLGFISLVALTDGAGGDAGQFPRLADGRRLPDIYSRFVKDLSMAGQPRWPQMSDAERADSLDNGPDLVWADDNTANGAAFLESGLNQGYVRLHAPSPVVAGSSIAHWADALVPDQLMEPVLSARAEGRNGLGLAACALEAMGWTLINGTRCPDFDTAAILGSADDAIATDVVEAETADADDDGGGSSGGGCTLGADTRFDPVWALLLGVSAWVLVRRRASWAGPGTR